MHHEGLHPLWIGSIVSMKSVKRQATAERLHPMGFGEGWVFEERDNRLVFRAGNKERDSFNTSGSLGGYA